MNYEFKHNKDAHRFELTVDSKFVAIISYTPRDGKLYLDHTRVPDELSGQGVGKVLATKAFDAIKDENLHAVATCSYLVALVKRNPQWQYIEI